MKLVLYTLIITLELIAFSFQKEANNEDINAILDKLIKQTEGKDNGTNGTPFHAKERSDNDSKIIYVKTNMKLDDFRNLTGELKGPNDQNVDDPSKYDTVSEELVLEIEAPEDDVKNEPTFSVREPDKKPDNDALMRSAYPDDYLENDSAPDRTLDSYVPKIQEQPHILSRYPVLLTDPESNSNKHANNNNDFVREMLLDLMKNNDQVDEEPLLPDSNTYKPEGSLTPYRPYNNRKGLEDIILSRLISNGPDQVLDLFGNSENPQAYKKYPLIWDTLQPPIYEYPRHTVFDNLSESLATLNMNTAIRHSLWYQKYLNNLSPMDLISDGYHVPAYPTPPKVRAVYQHPGPIMPFETERMTGTRCCTYS